MKTITFYSYKGGVGRSLALSNIAIKLSEYNKKVCIIDFDLDAPGLQFKFKKNKITITKGIVDYIHEFSCNGNIPKNIKEYAVELHSENQKSLPIMFLPAGNIDSNDYWLKLTSIKWSEMLYGNDAKGISFFLDMKAKIKQEFSPDFLLIDSRTGITDMSGITLRLLADEVVILATSNEENIYGSKKIIKNLLDPSLSLFGEIPKINFFLTRLPFNTPKESEKEYGIVEKVKNEFKEYLNIKEFEVSVIHSDKRLEEDERQMIGDDYEEKTVSISNDYLKLFDKLTTDVIKSSEKALFKNKKAAEREFIRAQKEKNPSEQLKHINIAITLDSIQYQYFLFRARIYTTLRDYDKAIEDYSKVLDFNINNISAYNNLGYLYTLKGEETSAISYFDKAIQIDPNNNYPYLQKARIFAEGGENTEAVEILGKIIEINPNDHMALNSRADAYRNLEQYDKAKIDIYKAIEANAEDPIYFGTLAEINACEGKLEDFYLNLTIALSKGATVRDLSSAKDIYQKFREDERFKNLMDKYQIDIEEFFKETTDSL